MSTLNNTHIRRQIFWFLSLMTICSLTGCTEDTSTKLGIFLLSFPNLLILTVGLTAMIYFRIFPNFGKFLVFVVIVDYAILLPLLQEMYPDNLKLQLAWKHFVRDAEYFVGAIVAFGLVVASITFIRKKSPSTIDMAEVAELAKEKQDETTPLYRVRCPKCLETHFVKEPGIYLCPVRGGQDRFEAKSNNSGEFLTGFSVGSLVSGNVGGGLLGGLLGGVSGGLLGGLLTRHSDSNSNNEDNGKRASWLSNTNDSCTNYWLGNDSTSIDDSQSDSDSSSCSMGCDNSSSDELS